MRTLFLNQVLNIGTLYRGGIRLRLVTQNGGHQIHRVGFLCGYEGLIAIPHDFPLMNYPFVGILFNLTQLTLGVDVDGGTHGTPVLVLNGAPEVIHKDHVCFPTQVGQSTLFRFFPVYALFTVALTLCTLFAAGSHEDGPSGIRVLTISRDEVTLVEHRLSFHSIAPQGQCFIFHIALSAVLEYHRGVTGENAYRIDTVSRVQQGCQVGVVPTEAGIGHQAFINQIVNKNQGLSVFFGGPRHIDLAVIIHIVPSAQAAAHKQAVQPHNTVASQGIHIGQYQRLFIGLAVFIGVLILKGSQYCQQAFIIGGHWQIQIVKPCLIDVNLIRHLVNSRKLNTGEGIHSAMLLIGHSVEHMLAFIRIGERLFKPFPKIGRLFLIIEIWLQINEEAGITVILKGRSDTGTQVKAPQNIGKLHTGVNAGRQHRRGICSGEILKLDIVAGGLLQPQGKAVGIIVLDQRRTGNTNHNGIGVSGSFCSLTACQHRQTQSHN